MGAAHRTDTYALLRTNPTPLPLQNGNHPTTINHPALMAQSFTEMLVGTLRDATNDFDTQRIEEYTGTKVHSVDEFMSKSNTFQEKNYWKGFVSGLIGGLVATGIKMIVDRQVAPNTLQVEDKAAASARASFERATGTDVDDNLVETAIEFGMGALIGGAYGLVVEALPEAHKIDNEKLMSATKRLAVPALGLIPAAGADVVNHKAENMAGHAAFVGTVEVVRRAVRLGMEEG